MTKPTLDQDLAVFEKESPVYTHFSTITEVVGPKMAVKTEAGKIMPHITIATSLPRGWLLLPYLGDCTQAIQLFYDVRPIPSLYGNALPQSTSRAYLIHLLKIS